MSNDHESRRSDSNHPSESPDDRIHRFVGEYELLDVVGRGGMGVVHRARHRELGHIVASKFLGPGRQADLVEIGRFRREAEALSRLDHPRIVPISSFGNHEGRPYFTMPLCDYGSLDQQLSRFTDRPRAAARIVREAARGVHHAHQWGILHRNLKPSKILLDERGEPRVADFGLARMLGEPCDLTPTGNILGSLPYVSPEACLGRAEEVNTLSDGYGLGAILYALSTAQAPFGSSSTAVTIERIVIDDPPPPRRTHPGIPRDLETICLKCLENSQADRYDSAYALADDLGRFPEGYPIEGRRVGGLRRLQLLTSRLPWIAFLSAAVVVAIVGGLVFSLLALAQARRYARVVEGTANVIMGGLIDRLDPLAPEPSARIDLVSLAESLKRTYDESTQQVAQSSGLSRLIIASLLLADLGNRRRASGEPAEAVDINAEIARIQDSLAAPPPATGFSRLPQQPAQAREAWLLARCEMLLGNQPAALARYAEILRDDPPPPVRVLLEREMIRALEALGRRDEADALRGHVERLTRELAETITRSRRSNTGSVRESLPLPITPR